MMQPIFQNLAARAQYDEPPVEVRADGKTYCSRCGELRWLDLSETNPALKVIVRPVCSCIKAREAAVSRSITAGNIERVRGECFADYGFLKQATFARDDRQNISGVRDICMKYVEKFGKPDLSHTEWMILFGNSGVGKSFYAACIANALISQGVCVKFTSISRIEQRLFVKGADKAAVYAAVNANDLLILDDLGAERRTEYMDEIIFNVVEYRVQADRPMLITSNLTKEEFQKPNSTERGRIFSRLWGRCLSVRMSGCDRRQMHMAQTNAERLRALMS